jgi:hypothetical protein
MKKFWVKYEESLLVIILSILLVIICLVLID